MISQSRAFFASVTPMIPAGASVADAMAFYQDHLGFSVVWQDEGGAGIVRDGVAFNLVKNDNRVWADNSGYTIGVSELDALYEEYRGVPAKVGPLEAKPWGRREFHVIVPSGVCLQFYQRER